MAYFISTNKQVFTTTTMTSYTTEDIFRPYDFLQSYLFDRVKAAYEACSTMHTELSDGEGQMSMEAASSCARILVAKHLKIEIKSIKQQKRDLKERKKLLKRQMKRVEKD